MRIGDILVAQNVLRAAELERALAEQPHTGRRLCSMLIGRGLLDFDDGARALATLKGVPCALHKHLEQRDRDLAPRLPAELARACCALPIARTRAGQLVIAVRDPAPQLRAALEQAARTHIHMIISPATQLEQLVELVYGAAPRDELDVDLDTGPIVVPPPLPDMAVLDPDSIQLTSLDDLRVTKDPSQSGQLTPALSQLDLEPDLEPDAPGGAPSIELTKHALDVATTRDAATQHAMDYIARRWADAVLFAVKGTTAIGYRGHGEHIAPVETLTIPLGEPSTLQRAAETRRTAVHASGTAAQRLVESALGTPRTLAAAPVIVAGQVVAVLAVGDPLEGDPDEAIADLGLLAEALSGAYERIHTRR